MLGQRLIRLVDGEQLAGVYTARWDGTDAAGRAVGAGSVYLPAQQRWDGGESADGAD